MTVPGPGGGRGAPGPRTARSRRRGGRSVPAVDALGDAVPLERPPQFAAVRAPPLHPAGPARPGPPRSRQHHPPPRGVSERGAFFFGLFFFFSLFFPFFFRRETKK